jgi:hypothetical protein
MVDDHCVHVERGDGDELLAVVVGRGDGAQLGVLTEHRRAQPGSGRVEGHAVGGRHQPEVKGALVELHELDGAGLPGLAEVGFERDRVERHEAVGDLAGLPGRTEQPHVGAAVAHDVQIAEVAAEDRPHQRHRLAA